MKRYAWVRLLIAIIFNSQISFLAAFAQEPKIMTIFGAPQNPTMQIVLGNAWALYLDGSIDLDAAKRLEAYILQNEVPRQSWVILNSPGGSLFGGMELGKVIRKYDFRTDIGERKQNQSRTLEYDVGGCYSACTLAFVGGSFRFLNRGSHFGIHRFAFTSPQNSESDLAQVASASIVSYLRSMSVDPDCFTLSTRAGPSEIYEPSLQVLEKLNVVNWGFNKPRWSVESNKGYVYLKGERETEYGINKFLMYCPDRQRMALHVIFDPQGHEKELMRFQAHSLVIDGEPRAITPHDKTITNGWFNSTYVLTAEQLSAIRKAKSVGIIIQMAYGAPVFLGFNNMPFEEGAEKLTGLANMCAISNNKSHHN
jgi:hypothetical protein